MGDELTPFDLPQHRRGERIVECHSSATYAERPIALCWEGVRLVITAILAQWRIPDGRCFAVKVEDGRTFELAYNENEDDWKITLT